MTVYEEKKQPVAVVKKSNKVWAPNVRVPSSPPSSPYRASLTAPHLVDQPSTMARTPRFATHHGRHFDREYCSSGAGGRVQQGLTAFSSDRPLWVFSSSDTTRESWLVSSRPPSSTTTSSRHSPLDLMMVSRPVKRSSILPLTLRPSSYSSHGYDSRNCHRRLRGWVLLRSARCFLHR